MADPREEAKTSSASGTGKRKGVEGGEIQGGPKKLRDKGITTWDTAYTETWWKNQGYPAWDVAEPVEVNGKYLVNADKIDLREIGLTAPGLANDAYTRIQELALAEKVSSKPKVTDPFENEARLREIIRSAIAEGAISEGSVSAASLGGEEKVDLAQGIKKRSKTKMKTMSKWVHHRDIQCVVTGVTEGIGCSHIIARKRPELLEDYRKMYEPVNGILLATKLEATFEDFQWTFDKNGKIEVLFDDCVHAEVLEAKGSISLRSRTITLDDGMKLVEAPDPDIIDARWKLAQEQKKSRCPKCWAYLGEHNVVYHAQRKDSCDRNLEKLQKTVKNLKL